MLFGHVYVPKTIAVYKGGRRENGLGRQLAMSIISVTLDMILRKILACNIKGDLDCMTWVANIFSPV